MLKRCRGRCLLSLPRRAGQTLSECRPQFCSGGLRPPKFDLGSGRRGDLAMVSSPSRTLSLQIQRSAPHAREYAAARVPQNRSRRSETAATIPYTATVTRKNVAGMCVPVSPFEPARPRAALFSFSNNSSNFFCSSPALLCFSAASNAFIVGP